MPLVAAGCKNSGCRAGRGVVFESGRLFMIVSHTETADDMEHPVLTK
jgi:hypothetical protein